MIVLDSSFLIASYNERDAHHRVARRLMDDFLGGKWGNGLLLEYVFLEVVTVLLVRRNLSVAQRAGRILLEARELDFVPSADFFLEAVEIFLSQASTHLSFTDAAIMAAARTRCGGLLLTFDEEFRKVRELRPLPERPVS